MTLRWDPAFARKGDWQKRFGAARLKRDRALLEAAERAIAAEGGSPSPKSADEPIDEARERLARAFGRPVA